MDTQTTAEPELEARKKMVQKLAFHLLFVHDFLDRNNVPEHAYNHDNVVSMWLEMREAKECTHTHSEIFG